MENHVKNGKNGIGKGLNAKEKNFIKKIQKIDKKLGKKNIDWKDIGDEFKLVFYNARKNINNLFLNLMC